MSYSIRGLVAERKQLELISAADEGLGIVNLDYPAFALLPLTDYAATIFFDRWNVALAEYDDVDVSLGDYQDAALRFMDALCTRFPDLTIAFVEAQISVEIGGSFGLAVREGRSHMFSLQPEPWFDAWPDTNLSLA